MRPPCPLTLLALFAGLLGASDTPVSFSLQIRPLLSEKCFSCHGPDARHREAKLRFDDEDSAKGARKGGPAIVANDPDASQVWRRLTTSDADDVMPPPKSHRTLDAGQ
jgi:mono/diheme cytochrome c family protein